MANRPAFSFARTAYMILRIFYVAMIGAVLIGIAWIFAAFGHRDLLNQITSTFRKWHLLRPRNEEEKLARKVLRVNWHYRLSGLHWYEFIWYFVKRATWRRFMPSFLEEKVAEQLGGFPNVLAALAESDDIALVIGATSLLDRYLGLAMVIRFPTVMNRRAWERVFEGDGPLSAFSAKISMAGVLGLLVGDMPHDLTVLRKIRNDFAHVMKPQSLSDPKHSPRCRNLKMTLGLSDKVAASARTSERKQLLESVAANIAYLAIVMQRGIIERQVVVENSDEISKRTQEAMQKVRENAVVAAASGSR